MLKFDKSYKLIGLWLIKNKNKQTWNSLAAVLRASSDSDDWDAAICVCKAAMLNNTQTFSYDKAGTAV